MKPHHSPFDFDNGNAAVNCHASFPIHPSSLTRRNTIAPPPTLSSVLLWRSRAPSLKERRGWTPEAAAGGQGMVRGKGGRSGRVRAEDRTARGQTRGKPTGRPRILSPCVGACDLRADAGEGRPAARCFRRCAGIARREGGNGGRVWAGHCAREGGRGEEWGIGEGERGIIINKMFYVVMMAGGGLSREILVAHVGVSTIPCTNEL